MLNKSLVALTMLSTFLVASEMELVLEVGRDNTELSAKSQAKIDATESDTDFGSDIDLDAYRLPKLVSNSE